jgi:hypothetical protein
MVEQFCAPSLKKGIYKPVRAAGYRQAAATLATFSFSGLVHQYVWYMLFLESE